MVYNIMTELSPEIQATVKKITTALNEEAPMAVGQITRVVERLGNERALQFLEEALQIEDEGGMSTSDEKRRRTPGGVYLYLIRKQIPGPDRRYIWPQNKKKKTVQSAFAWPERISLASEALKQKGEAKTVKITLIGRPGRIVKKEKVILTVLQDRKGPPTLPKGLPQPPKESTSYVVYITTKQWRKVSEALKNPEDLLIVEGYSTFDKKLGVIAVFAINTTTKMIQAARREAQRQEIQQADPA